MKPFFYVSMCLFALFFTGLPSQVEGQNLVQNPSFENFSACPLGPSEIHLATNWLNPDSATPDLYNSCSWAIGGVSVPNNILGSQAPRTGNGYAGLILGEWVALFGCTAFLGSGWREYLENQLSAPLVAGTNYCVSMYVSLADNVKYSTDDIGIYFSNSQVGFYYPPFYGSVYTNYLGAGSPFNHVPQLTYAGAPMADATNWVLLQWIYTASGGEQYMVIGNFNNDGGTTRADVNCGAFNPYAYWYVDDVSVVAGSCILPVELSEFEAFREEEEVELNWNTAREVNAAHFVVERSADGVNFKKAGEVPANGSERGGSYYFRDELAGGDSQFYRIKSVDWDGSAYYSRIVSVSGMNEFQGESGIFLQEGELVFSGVNSREAVVFDLNGRVVQRIALNPERSREKVVLPTLQSGLYIVRAGTHSLRIKR